MQENLEQALQDFLLDIDCLDELRPWTDEVNIFDILNISKQEKYHSQMIAWLLDVHENHGFGMAFFRMILEKLMAFGGSERYDREKMLSMDLNSFNIYKDWKAIDLVLISEKERVVMAIANKVLAKDRDQQLSRHRLVIEKDFPDYEQFFIFLSPEGRMLSDIEKWDTITYGDMADVLEELCHIQTIRPDVEFMLRNYKDSIRRDIVDNYQLINLCNKIYNKHRKALDLIFEYRMDEQNLVGSVIKEALKELADAGRIIFDDSQRSNSFIMFYTSDMDEYLLPLDEENSSYRTNRVYCYNIIVRDKTLYASFEIGGYNTTDAHKKTMRDMINLHKPKENLDDAFKYKRIIKTKTFDFSNVEELDETIRGVVQGYVEELLIMEAQLLFNLDNLEFFE